MVPINDLQYDLETQAVPIDTKNYSPDVAATYFIFLQIQDSNEVPGLSCCLPSPRGLLRVSIIRSTFSRKLHLPLAPAITPRSLGPGERVLVKLSGGKDNLCRCLPSPERKILWRYLYTHHDLSLARTVLKTCDTVMSIECNDGSKIWRCYLSGVL